MLRILGARRAVASLHERSVPLLVGERELDQPLDRRRADPARDDQSRRPAVQVRHGAAVHLEGDHRMRVHGLPDRMAPDEVRRLRGGGRVVAVGHHVGRGGTRPGEAQNVGEPHAFPYGGAHGAVLPLDAGHLGGIEAAAVARAFEREGLGDLLHPLEVVQPEGERIVHLPVHLEGVLGGVDLRPVVVVPDEEELGRRDVRAQLSERSLEIDGAGTPHDQLFLAGHGRRRGLRGNRNGAAEKRGRCSHVDHERATCDAIVHERLPTAWPLRHLVDCLVYLDRPGQRSPRLYRLTGEQATPRRPFDGRGRARARPACRAPGGARRARSAGARGRARAASAARSGRPR